VTGASVLAAVALLLALAATAQLLPEGRSHRRKTTDPHHDFTDSFAGLPVLTTADARLGLSARIARAGLATRISPTSLLAAKAGGAMAGALWALVIAPSAPNRLAWFVAAALPSAGFVSPDAWLERRARRRLRALRVGLPDALDLLAVGTAAGRSPLAGLAELGAGEGPLARELAMLSAESSCGLAQSEALESLRRRAPVREVAAMCGVIERSRR
jgi:tight adherence protein C